MDRYRRAVAERWRHAKDAVLALKAEHAAKVTARKGRAPVYERTSERELNLWTLERLHLAQLERTGQVDEVLAVLREDLSEAHAYSQVVSFLEKHGRLREAFAQAEQGCKAFPDDWRLQDDLLRCYERDGWTAEALALRRRQFERGPSVERYHLVLKAGQAAGQDAVTLRQALIDFLVAQEVAAVGRQSPTARFAGLRAAAVPGAWDVSLRAEILCSEGLWSEACALVQVPALCRDAVLSHIARHLPADQKDQALALLLRVFGSAMQRASSPYREELALAGEIGRRMSAALPATLSKVSAQPRTWRASDNRGGSLAGSAAPRFPRVVVEVIASAPSSLRRSAPWRAPPLLDGGQLISITSASAISAGFSSPSISIVFSVVSSTRPPPLSSTAATLMWLRTRLPARSGARKRTFSSP